MHEIEQTHPWITFSLRLNDAPARLWLLLGEARSKCEHLAGTPLMPEVARELHEIYLAKGVHATTAIEGNTLKEQEVLGIIRKTANTPPSQDYLRREIQNIVDAANGIIDTAERKGRLAITINDIKKYNSLVLRGLEVEEHVIPGEISRAQVGVPGYRGAPIHLCDELLRLLVDWLNSRDFETSNKDFTVVYGLIKAIVAHVYLVWIHPFGDGNGRTARLMELRFLLESGVPSAAGHLLSNHYNQTRSEYYKQLDRASKNGGDLTAFIEYAVQGFVDEIREQITAVKMQQWDVSWTNYVHEIFADAQTATQKRQRNLALALSEVSGPISRRDIRRITAEIAEEYAGKGEKTITRDLNALEAHDLIARDENGYRAKKEIILQFLPRACQGDKEAQLAIARQHMNSDKLNVSTDENDQFSFNV